MKKKYLKMNIQLIISKNKKIKIINEIKNKKKDERRKRKKKKIENTIIHLCHHIKK